jgi:RHS repeat-associated protein
LFCPAFNDDDGDCPVTAEARITTISYDPNSGYLSSITDALNRKVVLTVDQVGRVTSQTLPDGRQINYDYDENGNTTAITPPSKPVHEFDYTAVDLQQQYTPPTLTGVSQPQTQYEYNLDKQLIQIRRPDGQAVDLVYDSVKKHLNRLQLPNFESIRYTYDDSTGQLVTLTAPNGNTLSYTYDGSLVLSETWGNGPVTGTLTRSYNTDFKVTASSINGNPVNYQYDNDGLLTQAGDLSLTRNRQNGLLTATQLGNIIAQRTHNLFGEMASETASLNSDTLYRTEYQRDKLGRITQKAETVEGITTTYNYRYDVAGRLVEVKQDERVVETYSYDDNGNRLSADTASGSVIGNYDDQDRLTQYGNATYSYTENGELRHKNENSQVTEYNYDVLGNLRSVQLPNGNKIEYVIDARNRRIGKKVNGVLTQAFLYQGSLNPVAELDGNGNMVSQFVYGSKGNVPDYMLKDGKTYRILSNHLGSPKLVVDISDGSVVQKMDYDAFGNVTFDSNPGFQPFGFAGGIYDLDIKLTRFGARDYDARIGRWTAKDSILFKGGDTNLFGYVLGDPVNFIDPYGLVKISVSKTISTSVILELQLLARKGGGTVKLSDILRVLYFPPEVEKRIKDARGEVTLQCPIPTGGSFYNRGKPISENIPGTEMFSVELAKNVSGRIILQGNKIILDNLKGITADGPLFIDFNVDSITLTPGVFEIDL